MMHNKILQVYVQGKKMNMDMYAFSIPFVSTGVRRNSSRLSTVSLLLY